MSHSSESTVNIQSFNNELVEMINMANIINGSHPTRPRPLLTSNTRLYPEHDNPDHNSLHRYLLDPRNTTEVLMRLSHYPNAGELAEIWGWML